MKILDRPVWVMATATLYTTTHQQTNIFFPHRLARAPLQYLWMVRVARRILAYMILASHPLTWLWIITAATRSLSALSLSRRATCPARKNTLVFPKQYWSGSWMSSGSIRLHKTRACSWVWGPRRRMRYLLKNSSYVHLKTMISNIRKQSPWQICDLMTTLWTWSHHLYRILG